MTMRDSRTRGERGFDVTPTVTAPRLRPNSSAPSTYRVVPLAESPTTTSRRDTPARRRSRLPSAAESSAPSSACRSARMPPATTACTIRGGVPNVGGHSAASRTARRPLVPAPTYRRRPPRRNDFTIASTALEIAGSSRRTATATRASSWFNVRRISSVDFRSSPRERGFRCSVLDSFNERLKLPVIIAVGELGTVRSESVPVRIVTRELSCGGLAGGES